jgi:UPF0176 protein
MQQAYNILLYYCYAPIKDPEAFRKEHHYYCIENGLRGRIIIAPEGINGTISGPASVCNKYMFDLKADERFEHTHFKVTAHHQHVFKKLHVRVKSEIVHTSLLHINPHQQAGPYITSQTLQRIQTDKDVVLLDMRSNYEHKLGKFKGAVTLDMDCLREFPSQVDQILPYREKKIITYCTGGVKCEKASAYLLEKGFKNVYQLHGGIIQYGLETNGENFEGQCYVFDDRLTTQINKKKPTVISSCYVCHAACDRMVNCANPTCNIHVPICESCAENLAGTCSTTCQQHPEKRSYDGTGYYVTKTNGYNPYQGWNNRSRQQRHA